MKYVRTVTYWILWGASIVFTAAAACFALASLAGSLSLILLAVFVFFAACTIALARLASTVEVQTNQVLIYPVIGTPRAVSGIQDLSITPGEFSWDLYIKAETEAAFSIFGLHYFSEPFSLLEEIEKTTGVRIRVVRFLGTQGENWRIHFPKKDYKDSSEKKTMAASTSKISTTNSKENFQTATFAAGCFWGVEEIFRTTPGVIETQVGYIGGTTKNPTYEEVCEHTSGHAEAVELKFDPKKISYEKLLDIFFTMHDPTQVNRQGPDIGTNYRSAIFYHSDAQKKAAEEAKGKWNKQKYQGKIATHITKAPTFWRAEEYHQKYFMKRGGGTCHL